jgi:hypothetical protein
MGTSWLGASLWGTADKKAPKVAERPPEQVIVPGGGEDENHLVVLVRFATMSTDVVLMGLGGADVFCRSDGEVHTILLQTSRVVWRG